MTDVLNKKDYWINCQYETTETHQSKNKVSHHSQNYKPKNQSNRYEKEKTTTLVLSYNLSSNPEREFVGVALMRWRMEQESQT